MTFYEKVLEEYKDNIENTGRPFLCSNSDTFKNVWLSLQTILMKKKVMCHAYEFLVFSRYKLNFAVNSIFIFKSIDSFSDQKTIRIDFLNWAIKNNLDI